MLSIIKEQVMKRASNVWKAMDKLLVKISKTKKHLEFCISGWYKSVVNTGYLYKIYLNLILRNNQT